MRLSDQQLARLRALSEANMLDTLLVERPTTGAFDPATGVAARSTQVQIYEGKGRITPSSNRGEGVVGEETVVWRDSDIYLPVDAPDIRVNDLVTITASQDPTQTGRVWRVTDVQVGTYRASRKLSAVQLQPSRTTENI